MNMHDIGVFSDETQQQHNDRAIEYAREAYNFFELIRLSFAACSWQKPDKIQTKCRKDRLQQAVCNIHALHECPYFRLISACPNLARSFAQARQRAISRRVSDVAGSRVKIQVCMARISILERKLGCTLLLVSR